MREEGDEINFKHWLSRTILVGVTLSLLVGVIDRWFDVDLLEQTILAIMITVMVGLFHEYLHYRVAIRLGYKPVWWRTKFRMGFSIDTENKTEERMEKDKKLSVKERKKRDVQDTIDIGKAPYHVIMPIALLIGVFGVLTHNWGIAVAGLITIAMHMYTYKKEGKEV